MKLVFEWYCNFSRWRRKCKTQFGTSIYEYSIRSNFQETINSDEMWKLRNNVLMTELTTEQYLAKVGEKTRNKRTNLQMRLPSCQPRSRGNAMSPRRCSVWQECASTVKRRFTLGKLESEERRYKNVRPIPYSIFHLNRAFAKKYDNPCKACLVQRSCLSIEWTRYLKQ